MLWCCRVFSCSSSYSCSQYPNAGRPSRVVVIEPTTWKSQKIRQRNFGHLRSSEQHADDRVWPTRCDFLLVFYSSLTSLGGTIAVEVSRTIIRGTSSTTTAVAALHQVLAGPMPCQWKNRTWRWDLPVIFRWVRLPSAFCGYLCLFGFSVFPFFLYYWIRLWILEC